MPPPSTVPHWDGTITPPPEPQKLTAGILLECFLVLTFTFIRCEPGFKVAILTHALPPGVVGADLSGDAVLVRGTRGDLAVIGHTLGPRSSSTVTAVCARDTCKPKILK